VASADGLRFVVPVRTVHAGPNPKYFGMGDGVTYYNLVSNQFTGLNGIVVPGTLRDSLVLLAVVRIGKSPIPIEAFAQLSNSGAVVRLWSLVYSLPRLVGLGGSSRSARAAERSKAPGLASISSGQT
jgi:hypothetical protein